MTEINSDSLHKFFQFQLGEIQLNAESRLHMLLQQGNVIDITVSEQEVYPHDIAEDIRDSPSLTNDEKLLALTLMNGLWLMPHYPNAVWSLGPVETVDLLAKPTVELGLGLLIDGQHFLALTSVAEEFLFGQTDGVVELVAMVEFDTRYGQPTPTTVEEQS